MPAVKILVVARKLKNYSGLRLLADEYGVPVSLAQTSSLAVQPLTELVRLLLQAVPDNRDGAEAYFALLRGGLVPLLMQADAQAADALREKIYFTSRAQAQQKVHEALAAEDTVLQICDEFIAQIHTRATLEEYGGQLLEFLEALQLEQRLGALYKEGRVALNTAAGCMQARCSLQKVVRRLLQDYADCQRGEEKFSLREFQKKLDDAMEQEEIIIQRGRQDGVLLTEALNVQGLSFDYVYLLGMREGEFPCVDAENWIYNDKERGELNAMGIDMPNTAQAYAEDAYFFAAAAATARQELTLTYAEEDGIQASPYVDDVQKLFYEISDKDGVQEKVLPKTQKLCLRDKIPASAQEMERRGIACDEQWLQKTIGEAALAAAAVDGKRVDSLQYNGVLSDKKLQQEVRRKIGSSFSASMLETYAACPFRFLGERVWRQQEFAPAEEGLQPADEGSLLHDVLAKFIGRHLQEKISAHPLNALTEELQQDFADVSAEYLEQGRIVSTLLWQAEQPRLERLLLRWLRYEYEEQLAWNGYMPLAVEWDFSSKNGRPLPLRLQDGSRVTLNGRIDRIDSDGENLVITDYKRSKAPSARDAEEGFDVQLPLYLLAAAGLVRGGMEVAGGSYYVLKEGRRKAALLLRDVGNSNLEYKKRSSGINDGWESFENFCCALLDAYIEKIYSGEFAAEPRKECSPFCALRSICRYHELGVMQNGGAEHE